MHFLKDYHPAYRNREELDALVKEKNHVTWMAMFNQLRSWGNEDAPKVPTLRAFKVVERTPTKMRVERNPYYFKIDPAGNQLPYVDEVDVIILLENSQMITFQAATGQLDFTSFTLETQNIPLLKLGEAKGLNKVHIWRRLHVVDVAIQPNYNYDDLKYRELVWGKGERRFIRALSHAIDRDQMNEVIYFGQGTPEPGDRPLVEPMVRGALRQGAYPIRPGLLPRTAGRTRPFRCRRRRVTGIPGRVEAHHHAGVHRFRDAEGDQPGVGARLLAGSRHRPATQDHRAAPADRAGHGQQDADDGVARGQGDRHPVPPLAGLVLSASGRLGHDDVEPLGPVPPVRRGTGGRTS